MAFKFQNYRSVQNKIENEGLGYFIEGYCSAESMPDKKGEELFSAAEIALRQFQEYVDEQAELCEDEED